MDEKSYTVTELRQAMRETGNPALATGFLDKLVTQADKNRSHGEFSEEQVRSVLGKLVIFRSTSGVGTVYGHPSVQSFINAAIRSLRNAEKPAEPVEGGVYRSPGNILYRRSQGRWQMFGHGYQLGDDELNYPWEEMERVL